MRNAFLVLFLLGLLIKTCWGWIPESRLQTLQEIIASKPESTEAYNALFQQAQYYEDNRQYDKAVQTYEKLLVSFPEKEYYQNSRKLILLYIDTGKFNRAIGVLLDLPHEYLYRDPYLLHQLAFSYIALKQFPEAENICNILRNDFSQYEGLKYLLKDFTIIYYREKRYEQALRLAELYNSLKQDGEIKSVSSYDKVKFGFLSSSVWTEEYFYEVVAKTYFDLGKFDKAAEMYQHLLSKTCKKESECPKLFYNLALSYHKAGRFLQAKEKYEKILRETPQVYKIFHNLASMQLERLRKNEK